MKGVAAFGGVKAKAFIIASCIISLSLYNVRVTRTNIKKALRQQISNDFNEQRHVHVKEDSKIAWLMSFPNSGTTYTLSLISIISGSYTATNYGHEDDPINKYKVELIKHDPNISVGVFSGHPVPSWSYPLETNVIMREPTTGYLLTKTHCGGYCFDCFVEGESADTQNSTTFVKACGRGRYVSKNSTSNQFNIVTAHSPMEKIARAVHIIRDPFDNVVARFHHHYKRMHREGSELWLAEYPNTRDGFRDYCNNELGEKWREKEQKFMPFNGTFDLIKDVPCLSDFFRYIQWHNLAFESTSNEHPIPTIIIYYENYTDNFNKTKDALLNFLEQDEVNEPPAFTSGKTYRNYFTEEEIAAVSQMFSKFANRETWYYTKNYFN